MIVAGHLERAIWSALCRLLWDVAGNVGGKPAPKITIQDVGQGFDVVAIEIAEPVVGRLGHGRVGRK
jgi:hypothetical protein